MNGRTDTKTKQNFQFLQRISPWEKYSYFSYLIDLQVKTTFGCLIAFDIFCSQRNKTSIETQNNQNNDQQRDIFFVILSYCLLIIISPIATFFGSKYFIFDSIFEPIPSNIWAAISAVVALHVALGLFLYRAYFSEETKPIRKQD